LSFDDRDLVFGGAPPGTPWGTLGAIVKAALEPEGYRIRIEPEASRGRCPGLVSAGTVHFGATQSLLTRWAYAGIHEFAEAGPLPRVRVIATIMMPAWLGIAVRAESGITDLSDIAARRMPVRVLGARGVLFGSILAHYGLSRGGIEGWGGRFLAMPYAPGAALPAWLRDGTLDAIMESIYAAYTPEACCWYEAAAHMNLRFLPLPETLIQAIVTRYGGAPGHIPFRLFRGVDAPVPSVSRPYQLIFGRDDMPEDFAYLLARTLDNKRELFRSTHIPFSYDSRVVAHDHGIPLHPGALRYYHERGY
jgi:uncharacterized protein